MKFRAIALLTALFAVVAGANAQAAPSPKPHASAKPKTTHKMVKPKKMTKSDSSSVKAVAPSHP